MAYQNNNYQQGNQKNYQQQGNYPQNNLSVSHVMKWQDGAVSFALTINGVTIYGMRVVSFTDKQSGQYKRFVAFPKRKGSDGKYYYNPYHELNDNEEAEILRIVDNAR